MAETSLTIDLTSDAPAAADLVLRVVSLTHRERVGRLSETEISFHVEQELPFEREDIAGLLAAECQVRVAAESVDRVVHGIFTELELVGRSSRGHYIYRAKIAPKLWRLSCTHRSRVFQSVSYPFIIQNVLAGHDWLTGAGKDVEFRLTRGGRSGQEELPEPGPAVDDFADYMQREYTVQVEETDLAFIQRLMEHEGLFCFFEHGDEGATLVVTDQVASVSELGTINWASTDAAHNAGLVTDLTRTHRTRSAAATVSDYNWRTPQVGLRAQAPAIEEFGVGFVATYGEHHKTPEEGAGYAQLRAEAIGAQVEIYRGEASSSELTAGYRFTLSGAEIGDFDQEYFLTRTELTARVPLDDVFDGEGPAGISASFEAIPSSVPYRLPRETPKPRLPGLMHARVDGVQIGNAAPIDDHGRYKILLPWDLYAAEGGRASRWVRMAQPHAGPDFGVHFPLHIGTEVVLAHLGGDPDRPVIVGSIPNPDTTSPVTRDNATQSRMKTKSGILVEFEDDAL